MSIDTDESTPTVETEHQEPQETSVPAGPVAPRRSDRPWRIVGLLTMFGAIGLLGYTLLAGVNAEPSQARIDASNLQPMRIEVNNFGIEPGMQAGLVNGTERTTITATGSFDQVLVPLDALSLVGLYRPGGTLVGLTRVDPQAQNPAVDGTKITPRTTAQTLVGLFPGVLSRDAVEVDRRITEATILPQFRDLERAVLASAGVLKEDPDLEFALGATVGALVGRPIIEPQCTTSGLALGGVCVTQGPNGLDIINQLDRWALLFDSADAVRLCAAVPPRPTTLTLTETGSCSALLHLAAPGPFSDDRMLPGGQSTGQLAIAAALTAFSNYGVPFADTVFGTRAQRSSATIERIAGSTTLINTQFRATLSNDTALQRLALDFGDPSASPRQRAAATVGMSNALMHNSRVARDLLGGPIGDDSDAAALLRLIIRSVDWVSPDAPIPFWQTTPTAEIDLTRFIGVGS